MAIAEAVKVEGKVLLGQYRLDWGVTGKEYKIKDGVPIWLEEIEFEGDEVIYTENYIEITYQQYLQLLANGQINLSS
jgi:hypothetical protein